MSGALSTRPHGNYPLYKEAAKKNRAWHMQLG
jgi:hypothetical protein